MEIPGGPTPQKTLAQETDTQLLVQRPEGSLAFPPGLVVMGV